MHPIQLFRNEDAVSPVIGVVLLVAITVILAAVAGAFVLGLADETQTTPTATFDFEKIDLSGQPDELRVTHAGGDSIANTDLYLTANVQVQDEDGTPGPTERLSWYQIARDDGETEGELIAAGDSLLVEPPNADGDLDDKEFRVVWQVGDTSTTLDQWRGNETS